MSKFIFLSYRYVFFFLIFFAGTINANSSENIDISNLSRQTDQFIQSNSDLVAAHQGYLLLLRERCATLAKDHNKQDELKKEITNWNKVLDQLKTGKNVLAQKRGRFEWAYVSKVDSSAQPMTLQIPESWNGKETLPLIVGLHGLGGNHSYNIGNSPIAHFQVSVNGRGSPFYRGLGEVDVLEAMDFVCANYPVDPDRILLHGTSMGGWGVNRIASRYPECFAGVVSNCGWMYSLPIVNLRNLPVQLHHGTADWAVPVGHMRLATQLLVGNDSSVHYYEYPNIGHGVWKSAAANNPLDFLLQQKRTPLPKHIVFSTDLNFPGKCYWLEVERLIDPHRFGDVEFTVIGSDIKGITHNIEQLRLDSLHKLGANIKTITIDNQPIAIPQDSNELLLILSDRKWNIGQSNNNNGINKPPYHRGGIFNIYDGKPIRIVVPDNWNDDPALKEAVKGWSQSADLRASKRSMPYGRIPVITASKFSPEPKGCHLILVGSPEQNPLVKRLLPSWPVTLEGKNIRVTGLGEFSMKDTSVSLSFYNPDHPECRTVWLFNQSKNSFPHYPPVAFWSWISCLPDVIVQDVSGSQPVLIAASNFDNDWNLISRQKNEPPLPESLGTPNTLQAALAKACRDGLDADGVLFLQKDRDWAKVKTYGSLSLSDLNALIPSGLQPLAIATLNQDQLEELSVALEKYKDVKLEFKDLADAQKKELVSIVFCENVVEELGCNFHYNFPKGTLKRTGKDMGDYIKIIFYK